nr:GTPase IMAP family member 8-like [Misgurnus anguillicaudatus]
MVRPPMRLCIRSLKSEITQYSFAQVTFLFSLPQGNDQTSVVRLQSSNTVYTKYTTSIPFDDFKGLYILCLFSSSAYQQPLSPPQNREEFELKRSAHCVKRQREVADRHITVIEAPGWWRNKPVEKSTELLKEEILLSVSLCPPGPHIVLLLIRADRRFKEDERKVLQGYVDLLGERVWSHTIVLFTHGDFLGDTSIEQHIEREGQDLQCLVEKCGNRYHIFNNNNRSETQIKDLLEKIEETVRENNGRHFEMNRKILQEIEQRSRTEEERANERMKRMKKQREMIRSQMSETQKLSDLRIVLMGYKYAGKSSSGNIILNRDAFDLKTSAQCVKRQREVADRHITVIEAPGWWRNKPVEKSTELLKQELLLSASLCPPGPHIVLLVIRVDDRFTDVERKVFQGYVDLLGERVWSHTIVLFTHGDFLGDTSIEQHIEREGQDLQCLVEKCGNRYHIFNNNNRSETQIKDLLEKIEETVRENNGRHFEMNRKILQEIEQRSRTEEERANERMKRMKKQREMIRSQMSDTQKLSDLRIVLMGYKCAGKSSSGNIILNRDEFDLKTSAQCVKRQREVANRHIIVIEAPGWWWNEPVEKSTELLKKEILRSVSLCLPGPHTVLLVIRVDDRFKGEDRKVLQGYVDLLGERVWSHTIVLFTHGDLLGDTTIEKHIESEGEDLQCLVEKCGNRYHLLNNNNRSDETQIKDLLEKIEETVTENNSRYFKMDRKILQKVEERSRAEDERAEERKKRMKKQREMIRSQMGDTQKLSDLRIVFMGYKFAGKSSSGNIILNRDEFDLTSAQCVKRQREVADRHITVIEAPGWWRNKPVDESTELLKEEILLSVSLCPPGPHIVLLVIRADTKFKEEERKVFQGYVDLLGERVWSHTIVLFTRGDFLGDTTIEQHIESEGEDLQCLVEKCGNRYHLLNNNNRSDETQIKDLLEKIEETVTENNSCCFEMERKILQEMEERRKAEKERAEKRMKRMKKQREMIRSQMNPSHSLTRIQDLLDVVVSNKIATVVAPPLSWGIVTV